MSRSRPAGFTLVELIAVCAIVAVVVCVTAVRIDFLIPKYRLRGAAREVAVLLRQARSRAAATGREIFIEIDLSKGTYWLLAPFPRRMEDGREAEPRSFEYQRVFPKELPEGVEFTDVVLSEREKIDRGVARVRMNPFGISDHTIVNLRGKDGREMAVRMNGFTGHVSFYDDRREADALLEDRGP